MQLQKSSCGDWLCRPSQSTAHPPEMLVTLLLLSDALERGDVNKKKINRANALKSLFLVVLWLHLGGVVREVLKH